jgi:hypothetical protein
MSYLLVNWRLKKNPSSNIAEQTTTWECTLAHTRIFLERFNSFYFDGREDSLEWNGKPFKTEANNKSRRDK